MSSARSVQNSVGEEHRKMKRDNSDYDTFPSRELQVSFGNIVAPKPLNKPIHGF